MATASPPTQAAARRQTSAISGVTSMPAAAPPRAVFVIQCWLVRAIAAIGSPPTTKTRRSRSGLAMYSWT
ncbi:MAG: hypothetical protein R3B57_08435 [Phycisphaerales bacterium]